MSVIDVTGIVLGFVFLFAVLGAAGALRSRAGLDVFVTRKIVHISVAHWWLIALTFHETLGPALVGPIVFTVLNYISYRRSLFPALEYRDKTANLGTVYFPISLIVLVALSFGGYVPMAAASIGVFVLGYGDGLAALIGRTYGRRTFTVFRNTKSYLGSATMFVVASLISLFVGLRLHGGSAALQDLVLASVIIGTAAMLLEMLTPYGVDNITVPIGITLLATLLPVTQGGTVAVVLPAAELSPQAGLWAIGLNAVVALLAYRKKSVTESGALAGFTVGTVLFMASAGLWGLLMLFFLSSTVIGKLKPDRRTDAQAVEAKGSRRDAWQVFANAGAPTIAALIYLFGGGQAAVFAAIAGLAAATADTWSSEIGVLNRRDPVSILTFRPVPAGVSGGVSALGFLAGVLGALAVALAGIPVAQTMGLSPAGVVSLAITAFSLGTFGTVLDSLLGAGLQTRYQRPDGSITESPHANDGSRYLRIRGLPGITNDMVNFLTTAAITVLAVVPAL